MQACQNEIDSRQATIDEWQNTYDNLVLRQQEIQADLNFQDYLGEELYKIFCMYKREDTYQNDNYISDGLSDSEIIQKAKDFLEVAQKELEKARTPNHSISSTLHNLLIMPEFKPIIDNFKLGNWLRICVDGIVYRLRLIGYELSFSSIQTLSVEFSNVTKLNTIANETKNILDSAKSMASNFDYFVAQAKRGNEANVEITHWLEDGLQSALVNIKNNNNEEITFDKHGLWAKTYNSETGNYDPEMFRLTHNILAYTTDGFKTVKAALGKHNYYKFDESGKLVQDIAYGIRCDFVAAGYIYGSQIISGDIYSENYSSTTGSHINLKTGAFTLGSGKIVYNPVTNKMEIKGVNIEWSSSTTPEISDIDGLTEDLAQKSASITANADAITAEVKRASKAEGDLSASIKINADAITSEVKRATESEGNLSSKIEQTADSITSTVNKQITETKTYADTVAENAKNDAISDSAKKLKSYSTTAEMNSAINQKADSITSTVNKQITETKEYIDGEIETTKSDLSSEIKQTAESITSTVSETYETKENADAEYKNLQSSIKQTADEIELKVKEVSESTTDLQGQIDNTNKNLETNYSTTAEMESAIEIKADNITSSVTKYIDDEISTTKSDLSSEITQTAQSITSTVSETYETKTDAGVKYNELQSSIKQTAQNIELKVSKNDVCSIISQSSDKITIKSNRLQIESDYFTLASNGKCVAKNLYVESIRASKYANFLSNDTENGGVYTNANIFAEGEISCNGSLYAGIDLTVKGDASVHGTFWASSGTIDSSDRNVKNSIETLDYDKTCDFIYSLIPRKYKYNSGSSDRFHHGLIAQELKESMNNEDWGVFVDNTEAGGHLGIRYQELIADLITVVQVQNKRISELESKL